MLRPMHHTHRNQEWLPRSCVAAAASKGRDGSKGRDVRHGARRPRAERHRVVPPTAPFGGP